MSYEAQNREALIEYFYQGVKEGTPSALGVEVEHFVVYIDTLHGVPYEAQGSALGVREVLEYLAQFYPEKTYGLEGDLLGLASDAGSITLEPAAQLEFSIAPYKTVAEVEAAYTEFRAQVDPFLESHGAKLMIGGYHPRDKAFDLQLIPKQRYRFMNDYFAHINTHGERMMRASSSTQVSVDYTSEADAVRKMRITQALAPILASLSDNTHTFEGVPTTTPLERLNLWRNVDNARCGSVPGLFNPGWGFANYADWMLNTSPIFITRPAADDPDGPDLRPFYDVPAAQAYADAPMTDADREHLISMFWPDVRLKHFVEIRPADSMPPAQIMAYTALVKGVYYSEASLRAVEAAFGVENDVWPLNDESTNKAIAAIRAAGDAAVIYGKTVKEWKSLIVEIARVALDDEEAAYLDAFNVSEGE